MIVMARFQKGLFTPTIVNENSFETLKGRAFEGSDYTDEMTRDDKIALALFVLALILLPLLLLFSYFFYVWRQRKQVMKDLLWYRDLPYDGNLQATNDVVNAYKYVGADYNNLLSACILRLINDGAISIDSAMNSKGKTEQHFVIHSLPENKEYPQLLRMVHKIFRDAAGTDTVLEPKELRSWMNSLIYATLFGIADQVIRDMKKINPEYFNMDQVAQQMANETTLPMIRSTMHQSTARAAMNKAEREARAAGGGGRASWGGGGGFSGGGFGGGVR